MPDCGSLKLTTFQFATSTYLFALLPSIYTVRRHFPAETRMGVALFLGRHETLASEILNYLNELGVKVQLVCTSEARVARETVLSQCNHHFLQRLENGDGADVFYLDADCYFRRPPTWAWVEGDVVFGSRESARERAPQSFPGFCGRLGVGFLWNRDYCGSCVYVKGHERPSYVASLQRLLERNVPFRYFDDMHYRLAAAYLSGLRIGVAPKELEYKVVFGSSKSDDP